MSPTKQDDETAKDSMTPDFLKGVGISPEEEKQMEDAAYSGAADDIAEREGLSGSDLKAAEENPTSPTAKAAADPKEGYKAGFGYRDEDAGNIKKRKAKGSFLSRNKKWFIGGGLGGGLVGLILSLTLLLPLKVQHVANNLQSHFFASSEKATEDMTGRLFTQYIVKKVVPSMYAKKTCTTTRVSSSCVSVIPGDGPIARLYNAWREKNFEGKLATNQGLEIRREGSKFYLKSDRLSNQVELGDYDPKNPKAFERTAFASMSKSEVRRETRKAFENETLAKRIMYRYKVGHLLEKKYGVKRCLVACEKRDARQDRTELRKLKWKAYFIDRIVIPRNAMIGLAMKCAVGGFSCTEPGPAEEDGERTSEIERETRAEVARLASKGMDVSSLGKDAESIQRKGVTGHLVSKLTSETIGTVTGKAIPVIGWIDLASRILDGAKNAGPGIKKLNYVINSQSMVTMYMMYRTNADEVKTGEADAEDIGIVADSLGGDVGVDQGGATAEEAPIYQEIMGSKSSTTASIFSAFVPKTSAFNGYKCNDGSTITSGVCPEVALNTTKFAANSAAFISDVANSPVLKAAGVGADAWLATGGKVFDFIFGAAGGVLGKGLELIPGYDQLIAAGEPIAAAVGKWFSSKTINDLFGESPSGGRSIEAAAGGADVAGNSYAHYGLGGQKISDAAAAEIRTALKEREQEEFAHESMFARMFDTSSQYSVVSKMSLAMPSNTVSGTMQSFAGTLLRPLSSATIAFGGSTKTEAASGKDPFGVTQYGYSSGDAVFQTDDLQQYWIDNDCANPDKAKQWGDAEKDNINPDTGMPENNVTNPCKLIEASVGMAGAIYDESLLPAEELGNQNSNGSNGLGGGNVTVATYNILDGEAHAGQLCQGGESNSDCIRRRTNLHVKIITGQATEAELSPRKKNPAFDIVGLQEVSKTQYNLLKESLPDYSMFPSSASVLGNGGGKSTGKAIVIWNKTKLTEIGHGFTPGMSNVVKDGAGAGGNIQAPWVGLETSGGQRIYVMSIHWPNEYYFDNALGDKGTLREASRLARQWAEEMKAKDPKGIVLIMGDFNDHYERASERVTYCELTKGSLLQHSYDMMEGKNPAVPCPSGPSVAGIGGIDHIFATPVDGLNVTDTARMGRRGNQDGSIVAKASDHVPVWAIYSLPGGGTDKAGTSTMGDDYHGCAPAYGVCGGQCVDFVKFRLIKNGTKYKGGVLGDGKDVANNLGASFGYKVDHNPAVHAVVSWPKGGVPGSSANSTYGHVAIVGQVNKDGSIIVEEYNYANPGKYGTRKISASAAKLLTYAHTEVDYK